MKARRQGTVVALAALVALVAALDPAGGRGARAQEGAPVGSQAAPEAALSRQLARAVATAAPWVVAIRGPGPMVPPRPKNAGLPPRVRSGVVIAPGLVVTCASTIDVVGPDGVVIVDAAGQAFPARFRGRDLRLRVAILAADGLTAPPAPPPPAPRPVGSLVLALGAPLRDLAIPTATLGIVSAIGRFEGRAEQVDCPLDGSNIGGPLADLEGRVVGVTVHVDARLGERSGVGFAVSLDRVRAVLDRLAAGDQLEPGLLGLVLPKDDEPGEAGTGVPVRAVVPGSPAALAGLEAEDRVVGLHGRPTPDRRAFREVVADLYAGQRVVVEARRGGEDAPRRFELVVAPRQ